MGILFQPSTPVLCETFGVLNQTALTALKLAGSSGGAADSVPVSELVQAWDFDKDGVVSRSDLNSVVAAAVEEVCFFLVVVYPNVDHFW